MREGGFSSARSSRRFFRRLRIETHCAAPAKKRQNAVHKAVERAFFAARSPAAPRLSKKTTEQEAAHPAEGMCQSPAPCAAAIYPPAPHLFRTPAVNQFFR